MNKQVKGQLGFIIVGLSGVCALPLAAGRNKGGHYFSYFDPSGVRALPLAAGINEGGHYFRYILVRVECVRCPWLLAQTKVATILGTFFHLFLSYLILFFLPPLFKTTEGVVVGFQIFAWAPKKK